MFRRVSLSRVEVDDPEYRHWRTGTASRRGRFTISVPYKPHPASFSRALLHTASSPCVKLHWKKVVLLPRVVALGLSLVIGEYLGLKELPDGGSTIGYMFEVGLPALVFVIALYQGVSLWSSTGESVESST